MAQDPMVLKGHERAQKCCSTLRNLHALLVLKDGPLRVQSAPDPEERPLRFWRHQLVPRRDSNSHCPPFEGGGVPVERPCMSRFGPLAREV